MIIKKVLLAFLLALSAVAARADEGMWLPSLIGSRIKDMRSKGFRLSAEDIYSVNKASMKDAVVLFGGGCTGEFVSGEASCSRTTTAATDRYSSSRPSSTTI